MWPSRWCWNDFRNQIQEIHLEPRSHFSWGKSYLLFVGWVLRYFFPHPTVQEVISCRTWCCFVNVILPSSKLTWLAGKSPFSIGSIHLQVRSIFQPAMLVYQRVYDFVKVVTIWTGSVGSWGCPMMSNVQRTCDPKRPSEVPGWPHEPVPTCSLGEMERERGEGCWYSIYIYGHISGWCFEICFIFISIWGNDPIWRAYFSDGLKPPTRYSVMGGNDGGFERENCGAEMSMILVGLWLWMSIRVFY